LSQEYEYNTLHKGDDDNDDDDGDDDNNNNNNNNNNNGNEKHEIKELQKQAYWAQHTYCGKC
jgi:hypothetical protein